MKGKKRKFEEQEMSRSSSSGRKMEAGGAENEAQRSGDWPPTVRKTEGNYAENERQPCGE
ncbi:MAG: hypothetical protein IJV27_09290 [Prevotella sp.]|nr:hypothetical protein [Prevotella sp.]